MTVDEILCHFNQPRKSGQGWIVRCPSHNDKNPSLSIREGSRGILLKCWSGCSLPEICLALGIKERDLFYDAGIDSSGLRKALQQGKRRRETGHAIQVAEFKKADVLREAENTMRAATGIDDSAWSESERNRVMELVGEAVLTLIHEKEESFYD